MKYFKCIHTVKEHDGPMSYHTHWYPWLCHDRKGCVSEYGDVCIYAYVCVIVWSVPNKFYPIYVATNYS